MKYFVTISICLMLTGCGSTRQDVSQAVENYSETTTTPDGQVTTKIGHKTTDIQASGKTSIDMTPPASLSPILGLISGLVGGPVLPAILASIAAACAAHARAVGNQSNERKEDLEELWQMKKTEDAKL